MIYNRYIKLEILMRTLIDIPEQQLKDLSDLCLIEKTSRAELVRRAISFYLARQKQVPAAAFGLWKERQVDGLKYQERVRSEW